MKYYIVENKEEPKWVKATDAIGIYMTKNEDEAMRFEDPNEAEEMRNTMQNSTGNRWCVYEITEDGKRDPKIRHLDPVYRGYLVLKQQDEAWTKSVYDYLHKVLDKRPDKRIERPVDKGGSRFQLQTEYSEDLVEEVYIDDEGDIVINTSSDDTRYVTKDKYFDCSIEELFFLCECLEHYLNED